MSLTRMIRTQGLRTIIWLCVVAAVGNRWFIHVQAADTHLGFDVANASVPLVAIERGGPAKDGIPALTDPKVTASGDAHFMQDTDRVVGLALNGHARAYPIKILNWHEVANDEVGGIPIAISGPRLGEELELIPAVHTTWGDWRSQEKTAT